MLHFRSFLFYIFFYLWTAFWSLVAIFVLPLPRSMGLFAQRYWSRGMQVGLRYIVSIHTRYLHEDNIPAGPSIIACKHQSAWETTVFQGYLEDPAIVLKEELKRIPVFGWYVRKLKMIGVDRSAGSRALRGMVKEAMVAVKEGRQIVIFPEGTRVSGNVEGDYQAGVFALYSLLKIPVVPVGLNARALWPRDSYLRPAGTLYMEFMKPIEPGLDRDAFMQKLSHAIESSTEKLTSIAFQPPMSETEIDQIILDKKS